MPECPHCTSGIVRSVGRDNDEIITDCPYCCSPVANALRTELEQMREQSKADSLVCGRAMANGLKLTEELQQSRAEVATLNGKLAAVEEELLGKRHEIFQPLRDQLAAAQEHLKNSCEAAGINPLQPDKLAYTISCLQATITAAQKDTARLREALNMIAEIREKWGKWTP